MSTEDRHFGGRSLSGRLSLLIMLLACFAVLVRVILFYLPPPGVTKYCIQSCQAANAIIANAVATVTNSMTFSVNLLYRCVNSCTNIAIFLAIPPQ